MSDFIGKDVDVIVADMLDYKSLSNFCSVKRFRFDNEKFWKSKVKAIFGKWTMDKKMANRPWKNFYFLLSYYTEKENNNMSNFYLHICAKGHIDLVKTVFYNKLDYSTVDMGMIYATRGGHLDLVQYFISQGARSWKNGMREAARYRQLSMIPLFIRKAEENDCLESMWEWGVSGAIRGGHLDLVQFFIDRGSKCWIYEMHDAAKGGNMEIVHFLIANGSRDWNEGLKGATKGGHEELIHFFKKMGGVF